MRISGARSSPSTNDDGANNIPKSIATSARTNSHSTSTSGTYPYDDYADDPSTYSKSTFGTATYSAAKSQNGVSSSSVISRGKATKPLRGERVETQQPSSWVNQVKNRFDLLVESNKSSSVATTPHFSASKSTDFQEILNTSAITDHDNNTLYPSNTINCSSPQEFVSGAFTFFRAGVYDFVEYGDKICQSTNQKNDVGIPNVVGPSNNSSSSYSRRDSQKTIKTMNIDTNVKLPTDIVDNTSHPESPTDVQVDISNYTTAATGGDSKQQDLSIEMDKMLKMLWEKEAKGIGPTLAELKKCEQMYAQLAKETSNNNNSKKKKTKNNNSTDEISDIIDQNEKEADSLHLIDDKDTLKGDNDKVYVNSANKLMQLIKKKDTNMNNISTVMKNLDESNITMDSSVIGTRLVPSFSVDLEEEDNDIAADMKNAVVNKKHKEVPKASAVRAVSDPLFSLALDGKDDLVVDFEQSLTTSQVNADQLNTTQKVSNTAEVKIIDNVDDLDSDFTPNVSISSQAETSVCHNKTPIKLKAPPRGNSSGRNNKKIMRKMFSDGIGIKYKPKSTNKASVKKIKGTNEYVIPLKGDKDDKKKKSSITVDLDFSADFASDFPSTLPSSGKLDQNGFPVSSATDTHVSTLTETRICAWCMKGGKDDEEFAKTLKLCSACKTTYYCR